METKALLKVGRKGHFAEARRMLFNSYTDSVCFINPVAPPWLSLVLVLDDFCSHYSNSEHSGGFIINST